MRAGARKVEPTRHGLLVLLLAQLAITSAQPIVSLFVHSLVGPVDNLATLAGIAFSVLGVSGLIVDRGAEA